jgi:hypothetical protein
MHNYFFRKSTLGEKLVSGKDVATRLEALAYLIDIEISTTKKNEEETKSRPLFHPLARVCLPHAPRTTPLSCPASTAIRNPFFPSTSNPIAAASPSTSSDTSPPLPPPWPPPRLPLPHPRLLQAQQTKTASRPLPPPPCFPPPRPRLLPSQLTWMTTGLGAPPSAAPRQRPRPAGGPPPTATVGAPGRLVRSLDLFPST